MKPIRNRIIVQPYEEKEAMVGGKKMVLAEDKKIFKGEVVAVGSTVLEVKQGDKVMYSPFHFEELEGGLHIIEEVDVWAIL